MSFLCRQPQGQLVAGFRPGDLPDPGIEATSLSLAGRFFTTKPTGWVVTTVEINFLTVLEVEV